MTWYNINLNYQDIALFLKIAESKIDFGYKKKTRKDRIAKQYYSISVELGTNEPVYELTYTDIPDIYIMSI